MSVRIVIDSTYRFSGVDEAYGGNQFYAGLLNRPVLESQAKKALTANALRQVSVAIDNNDSIINTASFDLEGKTLELLVDDFPAWYGKITNWSLSEARVLSINAREKSIDIMGQLWPDEEVRLADFGDASRGAVEQTIPIVFGGTHSAPVRVPFVLVDRVNFRYLGPVGEIREIVKVWQDGKEISTGFTSYTGTSGQATYPGFAYIQFAADPRDGNGRWPEIFADVVGLKLDASLSEAESRNPAWVLYYLLVTARTGACGWGMGRDASEVDSPSFAQAVSDCASLGFYADGAIMTGRAFREIVAQVELACRGRLLRHNGANGDKYYFYVDKDSASAKTYDSTNCFPSSLGMYPDRKNRHVVYYRYDAQEKKYIASATREDTAHQTAYGEPLEEKVTLELVADHAQGGKICDYLSNVERLGNRLLVFETDEYSGVSVGSVVTINLPTYSSELTSALYRVEKITPNGFKAMIEARKYSSDYFSTTSPGSPPSDPATDPSVPGVNSTPPGEPSGLSLSTGNFTLADGTVVAYVEGTFTGGALAMYYEVEYGIVTSPQTYKSAGAFSDTAFRIDNLENAKEYIFRITPKNVGGSGTAITGTITTSSDVTAPGKPATPTLSVLFKNIRVKCLQNATKAADMAGFKVFRHTANDSASATEIGWVGCGGNDDGVVLLDEGTAYGATYYYWTKAVDRTGNVSAFSDPAGPVTTSQIVSGDLSAGSVCAMHINAAGISADCITAGTICADRIAALNGTTGYGGNTIEKSFAMQGANLLSDPDFRENPYHGDITAYGATVTFGDWTAYVSGTGACVYAIHRQNVCRNCYVFPCSGGWILRSCAVTNYSRLLMNTFVPIRAGATYLHSGYFASHPGFACPKVYYEVCYFTAALAFICRDDMLSAFTCVPQAYTRYCLCKAAPATAAFARIDIYNYQAAADSYLYVSALSMEEAAAATPWKAGESGTITANRVIAGALRSLNWGASAGSYFDLNAGTFCLGGSSAPKLEWDGSTLTVNGVVCATSGCFSGTITSTAGTIGGWSICSDNIRGSGTVCGCTGGIQLWPTTPSMYAYWSNGTNSTYVMAGRTYDQNNWQAALGFSVTCGYTGRVSFAAGMTVCNTMCLPDSSTPLSTGCPFFWVGTSTSYMKWYNGLLTLNGSLVIQRCGSTATGEWICFNNTCDSSSCIGLFKMLSASRAPVYICTSKMTALYAWATGGAAIYGDAPLQAVYGNASCWGVHGNASSCCGVMGYAGVSYPVVGNGAYYNCSVRSLKTNFEDIEVLPALRCLCIQKWTWNDQNMRGFDEFIGPVAEDVQAAFRLTFANDGVYQLDGIALKAAQELDACITAQNLCIESLAARLANIESRLSQCA